MTEQTNIPSDLRELDQWILWKLVERDGKATKVPCDASGKPVSVTDPTSWHSYADACAAHEASDKTSGIGFCFTESDPFVGIDLDDCIPLRGDAVWIAGMLGTYAEVSPSGTGIKFIGRGRLPADAKNRTRDVEGFGQIEVYDRDRFFTVTGNVFGFKTTVEDVQDALNELVARFLHVEEAPVTLRTVEGASSLLERAMGFEADDDQLIEYLRTDPRYDMLWEGDCSDYGDDQSAGDLALMEKIAWLVGPVPERIERIFSQSALAARSKWDRPDYRERTIAKALEGKTDFYSGSGHPMEAALEAGDVPVRDMTEPVEAPADTAAPGDGLSFPIPDTGIIRDFVDLLGPMTESPDATIAFGALIMLSAIAGWSRQIVWGENAEPVTLYGCITGKSAVGRKTTGMRSVENVTSEAFGPGELRMESGGHISGRALIEAAVGDVSIFYTKEPKVSALDGEEREEEQAALAEWHAKRLEILEQPPATVLVWDEFGKILNVDKDWQRDTRMELLRMYGGWHGGIKTSGKEGLKMPKGKVQMGLLATMTDDDLRRGLNAAQVTDGLMGRIIFTPDGDRKPPLSRPPMKGPDYELKKQALISKLLRFREKCGTVERCYDNWTSEAGKAWDAWYAHNYGTLTGLEALLFGRLQVTGVKIATLLAMAEGLDFVDADHIRLATQMVDVSIRVAMSAAEAAVEAQRDRYCDAVYEVILQGEQPLSKILERGMMNAKEPGEKIPERQIRAQWIKQDPRLELAEGDKGKGHKVRLA